MINIGDVTKENRKQKNPNQPKMPNHPHQILLIEGSGSGETNSLFNLKSQQSDNDKILFIW